MTLLIFYASLFCSNISALVFKMENFSCARGCISVTCYLNTTNAYLTSITCWRQVQHAQVLLSKHFLFSLLSGFQLSFFLYSYEIREVVTNNYVKTCVEKVSLKYDFKVAPYHGHTLL